MNVVRKATHKGYTIEVCEFQESVGLSGGTIPVTRVYIDNQDVTDSIIHPSTVNDDQWVQLAKRYIDESQ